MAAQGYDIYDDVDQDGVFFVGSPEDLIPLKGACLLSRAFARMGSMVWGCCGDRVSPNTVFICWLVLPSQIGSFV